MIGNVYTSESVGGRNLTLYQLYFITLGELTYLVAAVFHCTHESFTQPMIYIYGNSSIYNLFNQEALDNFLDEIDLNTNITQLQLGHISNGLDADICGAIRPGAFGLNTLLPTASGIYSIQLPLINSNNHTIDSLLVELESRLRTRSNVYRVIINEMTSTTESKINKEKVKVTPYNKGDIVSLLNNNNKPSGTIGKILEVIQTVVTFKYKIIFADGRESTHSHNIVIPTSQTFDYHVMHFPHYESLIDCGELIKNGDKFLVNHTGSYLYNKGSQVVLQKDKFEKYFKYITNDTIQKPTSTT